MSRKPNKRGRYFQLKLKKPRGGTPKPLIAVAGSGDCWCGQRQGHDWPGKAGGEPHPR